MLVTRVIFRPVREQDMRIEIGRMCGCPDCIHTLNTNVFNELQKVFINRKPKPNNVSNRIKYA